jgi:multisubunit Na+/H+ antiporter MnhB subunit
MKTVATLLLMMVLFVAVTQLSVQHDEKHEPDLFRYVAANYEADCHTTNAVTSILLNYRMYDTMFEVLILLTAIIGMKQFLPAPHELADADSDGRGKTRT